MIPNAIWTKYGTIREKKNKGMPYPDWFLENSIWLNTGW
jgi:hypothetical protein